MGTTLDAIKSDAEGVRLAISVTIEGYEHILTDWDTTAMVSAFSGTDWLSALPGLRVDWKNIGQEIDPWSADFAPTSITFMVYPGPGQDTFGVEVFRADSGNETYLTASRSPLAGSIPALDASSFDTTGTIYIGTEAIEHDSGDLSSDTFSSLTRGKWAPFKADGETNQRFKRYHQIPEVFYETDFRPLITSQPRKWQGRHVAVRLHRVVGTAVDSYDEAHLVFAGVVQDIQDSGTHTNVQCVDFREVLNGHIVHNQQWQGKVQEGLLLLAGQKFWVTNRDRDYSSFSDTWNTTDDGDELVVVASGASGDYEIDQGYYSIAEVISAINDWADAEGNTLITSVVSTPEGRRFRVAVDDSAIAGTTDVKSLQMCGPRTFWDFVGFESGEDGLSGPHELKSAPQHSSGVWIEGPSAAPIFRDAPREPYRSKLYQASSLFNASNPFVGGASNEFQVNIDEAQGVWVDMGDWLPQSIQTALADDSANISKYSLVQVGEFGVGLAKRSGSSATITALKNFGIATDLTQKYGSKIDAVVQSGVRESEAGGLVVKQILLLEGSFVDIVARLFLSTGGSGYNESTYDDWPHSVGASIPWEVLGDTFIQSLQSADREALGSTLTLLIEKPTPLPKIVGPDLLLRMAHLVFADGVYQFVIPPTPSAINAVGTLDDSSKGAPIDAGPDAQIATTERTGKWLRNTVKFEFNRDVSDEYHSTYTVKNAASISDHGETKPVTVKVPTVWSELRDDDDQVGRLAANVVSSLLPLFGQPVNVHRRTINRSWFHLKPCDVVLVTDRQARNLTTGERGITVKPGWVIGVAVDWGGLNQSPTGSVYVVLDDSDRTVAYSPCADVDDGEANGGYDSGNSRLHLKTHSFSRASEDKDGSHFEDGDAITIYEVDPPLGSSRDEWDRTVDGAYDDGGDYIEFTGGALTGWDSSKKYRIQSQEYSAAQASQQADAYMASEADALVEDTIPARRYGSYFEFGTFAADTPETRPEQLNTPWRGDGEPVTPAHTIAATRLVDNFNAYKWAPQFCFLRHVDDRVYCGDGANNWTLAIVKPIYLPALDPTKTYSLHVAPMFSVDQDHSLSGGETVAVRVTLSNKPPSGASSINAVFGGGYDQVEFSTGSQSWQIPTAKTLTVPPNTGNGLYYLCVEGESSDAAAGGEGSYASCWFLGLPEAWLDAPA